MPLCLTDGPVKQLDVLWGSALKWNVRVMQTEESKASVLVLICHDQNLNNTFYMQQNLYAEAPICKCAHVFGNNWFPLTLSLNFILSLSVPQPHILGILAPWIQTRTHCAEQGGNELCCPELMGLPPTVGCGLLAFMRHWVQGCFYLRVPLLRKGFIFRPVWLSQVFCVY